MTEITKETDATHPKCWVSRVLSSPPSFGGRTSAEGLSSLLHQAGSSQHLLKQDRHLPPLHNNGDTRLSCGIGFAEGSGLIRVSLVAQMVKNLPAMQIDPRSIPGLGRPAPSPLPRAEEGMATHLSSFLENPSPRGRKVRYNRANSTFAFAGHNKGKLEQREEQLETHL